MKTSLGIFDLGAPLDPLYQMETFQDLFHLVQTKKSNLYWVVQSLSRTKQGGLQADLLGDLGGGAPQ